VSTDARKVTIVSLRDRPEFLELAADRIWNAWWKPKGAKREALVDGLREIINQTDYQNVFLALQEDIFAGVAALIDDDFDPRPALEPWIAAVWVEPDKRKQGIGQAMVEHLAKTAFAAGFERAYLNATPENAPFYQHFGWTVLEPDVEGMVVLSLNKP
jgi:GNAT superfamily N-acetyltransferase